MLSRWFKKQSRLTHPDRDKRLLSVQALSAEEATAAEDALLSLATQDEDEQVRAAALDKIQSCDLLATLLEDPQYARAAAARIAVLLKAGNGGAGDKHPLVLDARIRQADAAEAATLIPLLSDSTQLAELAIRQRDAVREAALQHPLLQDEDGLVTLQRVAKGRDKFCHRYAKERLEAIKQSRAQCAALLERVGELDVSILKALNTEPTNRDALIGHRQHLRTLGSMRTAAVDELTAAQQAMQASGAAVENFQPPPDPLAEADLTLPEAAEDPFPPLVEGFEQLANDMLAGKPLEKVSQSREQLTQAWLAAADHFPPGKRQHEVFESASKQYQAYKSAWQRVDKIDGWQQHLPPELEGAYQLGDTTRTDLTIRRKWLKRWQAAVLALRWPEHHTAPQIAAAATQAVNRVSAELEQLQAMLDEAGKDLRSALKDAQQALEQGRLDQAKNMLRKVRQLKKTGVKCDEQELSALSARIAEFRDWQQFATDPKREALLTEIESLANAPDQNPAAQAERLKHLREQWRQLGKPASASEFEQQKRFDELADLAFAPCREYYAEQAEIRSANLQQRELICEQLATYLESTDWTTADMQAAESIMRSARDEWRKFHPCERRALKPVQDRFEQLQEALHGKVKQAWDANIALKQTIIDEAKSLLDSDLASQIEGAKSLQQRWRDVGSTPRGADQRLWREFREICDQIFAQRDADQQAKQAQYQTHRANLEQAICALEAASEASTPTRKALAELNEHIDNAATELKPDQQQRQRIDTARAKYHAALEQVAREAEQQQLMDWRVWDEQVSAAEQAGETMSPPHPVFADRLQGNATPAEWLELVLEAEIAADIPSPTEDQAARMALQVAMMNAGRRDLAAEDYQALLRRWCSAGPKDALANQLRGRFFDALAKRI